MFGLKPGVLLLVIILVAGKTSLSAGLQSCNRERSRLARSILQKYVLSKAYWSGYEMPLDCPLHPKQDIFYPLEEAKEQISGTKWNCSVCGAMYGREPELDQHLHEKHASLIPEEGQCLADLCDILHCDYIAEEIMAQKGPGVDMYARHTPCDPAKELQVKKKCREVAEMCFTPEAGPKAPMMWGFFHGHICLAHNCREDVRNELLSIVTATRPRLQWGINILAGSVTVALLGFYIIFWLYMRFFVGVIGEDEFTKLRPKKQRSIWPWRRAASKEL